MLGFSDTEIISAYGQKPTKNEHIHSKLYHVYAHLVIFFKDRPPFKDTPFLCSLFLPLFIYIMGHRLELVKVRQVHSVYPVFYSFIIT